MSKDGIVVICHDALLKRLYGVDANVTSLPWKDGLDQLRTIKSPHLPMMRFRELLEKIVTDEAMNGSALSAERKATSWKDTWILMDIKVGPQRHTLPTLLI
jgi:hypothetical protein